MSLFNPDPTPAVVDPEIVLAANKPTPSSFSVANENTV